MRKLLLGILVFTSVSAFADSTILIPLNKGEKVAIAFGDFIYGFGCEVENAPDNIVNLKAGDIVAVAGGEDVYSVSCN